MPTSDEAAQKQMESAAQHLVASARSDAAGADRWNDFDSALALANRAATALFGERRRRTKGPGGKQRILDYLLAHQGEWVSGEELQAVSHIGEWARRVRELRVEGGWPIEEDGGRYRLTAPTSDEAVAERWRVLNGIRRREGNARDRIRALLVARVGEIVNRDELDYVARIKEGSRRTREIRDEDGWPVESHIDDPTLQPGEYRLVSADEADRRDRRQRLYPENTRSRVFERDRFTCQVCRRDRAAAEQAGDNRFYLEVHHRSAVAEQLDALPASELNDITNLVTLCHSDHVRATAEFQQRRRAERRGD